MEPLHHGSHPSLYSKENYFDKVGDVVPTEACVDYVVDAHECVCSDGHSFEGVYESVTVVSSEGSYPLKHNIATEASRNERVDEAL